jgi:hypothetical protein
LSLDETPSIKEELLIIRLITYLNYFISINPEEITYIFDIQPSLSQDTLVFIYNLVSDRYSETKLMIIQMDEEIEAEMENFNETFKTLTAILFQENDMDETGIHIRNQFEKKAYLMKCRHALESIEKINESYKAMEEDSIRILNTSFAKINHKMLGFSVNNEITSPKLLRAQDELFQIIENRCSILKKATPQLQKALDLFQYICG